MKVEVDGRPGLPVPNSPCGLCGHKATLNYLRAQELSERRGGRPGLPVPNSPCGLCGRKATFEEETAGVLEWTGCWTPSR